MTERHSEETFCAPATAPVNSSLAIIRINGPKALSAAEKLFSRPGQIAPRMASYGSIIDGDHIIDDVVLTYFKAPRSFTGDDLIEISCHGNQFIVHRIIRILDSMGIRLAQPGEFSMRAFLNGKIGLTEAEAINHIITARSDWEVETALKQMHGAFSDAIRAIRQDIIHLKADIEAGIDFIEEDIEFVTRDQALSQAQSIEEQLKNILLRCTTGQKISRGIDVALVGKPNVGKSSILNLILNQERAIVSDIPGTTRDMIKESVQIRGIHINLVDMAGIDTPGNEIEKIGIELSHKNIETSPLILCVFDASTGITSADLNIIKKVSTKKVIYLINKVDISRNNLMDMGKEIPDTTVHFSARTGEGLPILEERISSMLKDEFFDYKNSFIADIRVISLLENAITITGNVKKIIEHKEPSEIVAFEMQSLLDVLSQITGEITADDVFHSIFSRFCIGK